MTSKTGYLYSIYFYDTNEIWYSISTRPIEVFLNYLKTNMNCLVYLRLLTEKYIVNIEFSCEVIKNNKRYNLYSLKSEKLQKIILNENKNKILNVIRTRTINIKRICVVKNPSQKYIKNKERINDYALNRYYENKDDILRKRKLCKFNCICGCLDLNWFYRASHFNTERHKLNLRIVLGLDTSSFKIPQIKKEKRIKQYIMCECGKNYERYSATTHSKSKFHLDYINRTYREDIVVEPKKNTITKEKRREYKLRYLEKKRLKELEQKN